MLIHRENFSATTEGGEWSDNTEKISGGICYQVYVKSASAGTVFDVVIMDRNDIEVRKFTDITNIVNDLTHFLVRDIYTISIESATKDEAFKVMLCFRTN